MQDKTWNVLFLCTGNSARSIMAEVLMNHLGRGRFRAWSAGSHPAGKVNPFSISTLQDMGLATDGLRSKNWDEFAGPGAPSPDFIFTVCDNAAGEICPVWPGKPVAAHWGIEDPAAFEGTDDKKRAAFREAALILKRRIELFISLPMDKLDGMAIKRELDRIGRLPEKAE
jgi:arsenate reductase (thioredoxin)